MTAFVDTDNWVAVCVMAFFVMATCGFLLVRFA